MKTTSNKGMETKQPSFLAGVTRGKILVRCVLTAALVVAALLMAACNSKSSIFGSTLQGKYSAKYSAPKHTGSTPDLDVEFKPGNKANYSMGVRGFRMTATTEVDYEVRDKEVLLKIPQGTLVGTIADDGCLDFSTYGKLCKQVDRTLSGTYSLPKESLMARRGAHWQIEFKSGNKANWSYSSPRYQQQPTVEPTYEIHGEEVTLRFPNATTRVATITDDGCLDFGGTRSADGHPIGIPMKVCK